MRKLVALVAVLAVIAPACGLGERERFADRVTTSTTLAIEAGTVKGTITASMRITEAPVMPEGGVPEQRLEMGAAFVADLGAHRSLLTEQHLLHDDLVLHLRRADAEENDARPWLTLDLDDLTDDARLPFSNSNPIRWPYTMFAIPPTVIVDLVAGALTGSLEALGTEEIDGVPVTGYRANFDLEKMLTDTRKRDYDEDRRDAVVRTFDTLDIDDSVHEGRVWLDGEGRPRRIEIVFDVKPRNRWTFETTMTLDLLEWGVDAPFDLPAVQESIQISSISRMMTELGRSFPLPEVADVGVVIQNTEPTVTGEQPPPPDTEIQTEETEPEPTLETEAETEPAPAPEAETEEEGA